MKLTYTKEDIDRGKTVEPGWYETVIKEAVDEIASDGQSMNTVVDFQIVGGNEGKFNGMNLRTWFNEKAPGISIPFFAALGFQVKEGATVETTACKGKKLLVYVANEMYKGKMQNRVSDYRPIQ